MKYFKEIFISDINQASSENMDFLIMCGSTNWNFYFQKPVTNNDEKLENISLVEFNSKEEMFDYIENNANIIDYSLEHNKPCLLINS